MLQTEEDEIDCVLRLSLKDRPKRLADRDRIEVASPERLDQWQPRPDVEEESPGPDLVLAVALNE